MKKFGLLVLVMLSVAQLKSTAENYATMSIHELSEALVVAVRKGSSEEVHNLIQAGALVDQKITYKQSNYDDYDSVITCTLLEYAAQMGYADIVKALIPVKTHHGLFGMIKKFLPLRTNNEEINKALIVAAKRGHTQVIKELVHTKPTINALNRALIAAAQSFPGITGARSLEVIKELIQAGAQVNHPNEYGDTALIIIADKNLYKATNVQKHNRTEIIQVLLQAKANVNYVDKNGDTALIRAIRNNNVDAVQALLQAPGIKINYANNEGNTALIIAVRCIQSTYVSGDKEQYNRCLNSQKIVELLLQAPGINPHHANKAGDTAITLLKKIQARY